MDLYGGPEVLEEARALPLGVRALGALDDLAAIAAAYGPERLLFDLGMSRRYGYYSGYTFRAYVDGHAQSLLGGGRYGGRSGELPGAGFAVGLERLTEAAARILPPEREVVLALDEAGVQHAQSLNLVAERAWTGDAAELERYAQARGIRRMVRGETFSRGESVNPAAEFSCRWPDAGLAQGPHLRGRRGRCSRGPGCRCTCRKRAAP